MTSLQQAFSFAPLAKDGPPPRRNLVIDAGAGTGKTTAIVGEVLHLLLGNENLDPQRIVLVTFTEKAAGEIADRIHTALTEIVRHPERSEGSQTAPGEILRSAQDDEDIVWPANSSHPLVELPASHRRAGAKQLERIDMLRSQTIHSFCQSLLRQFPIEANLDPQFKIIEGFERSLLYSQLYDAWIDAETRVNPKAEHLREWETLVDHVSYLFLIREILFALVDRRDLLLDERYDCGDIAEVEREVVAALNVVKAFGAPEAIAEYAGRHMPPSGAGLDAWIDYLEPIAGEIRAAKLPRKKNDAMLAGALKELRAGGSGESVYDRLVSHRAACAARSLAVRFIRFLDEEKRKLGVVDFDDLLLRTQALLEDAQVLERVRGQFDYLFVDEFQDTDRVQARIIDRLARDRSGALVPGRTVIVGDPKQSIYGFRRADPETYDRFARALREEGAELRQLQDQYRSEPPLLDAINAMFAKLFPPQPLPDANVFRPEYFALRAAKASAGGDPPLTFLDGGADEAEVVAAWLAERRAGGLRRFAILFRRTTYLDDFLDALDRHGVEYVLPPTKLFLDRRAPVDLLAVLRAIAYPFDRGAEISAARTPYFALTDDEIVEGADEQGAASGERRAWHVYLERLNALREASRHLTVAQLIDRVVAACGIEAVYDAAADGIRSLRHLEHLRTIAFQYDQRSGGSVRQFVDEIARRRHDPDEMEPSLLDDAEDAVRILTVHAAKGLEFETVILPDLDFNLRAAEAFVVDDPPSLVLRGQIETLSSYYRMSNGRPLKDVAKQREEAEMRRLFYVAVTRAMKNVVFVVREGAKRQGFYACLSEVFGDEMKLQQTEARQSTHRRRRRLRDAALEQSLLDAPIADLEEGGHAAAITPPPTKSGGMAAALQAGVLLHRVLERWDGAAPIDALLNRLAAEQACDRLTIAKVRQRLSVAASSETFKRIAAAETIGREVPVAIVDADGNLIERRIDRWLREPDGDLVIDYKSGAPDDDHRLQIGEYSRAVEAMTGRPCRGLIWYIGAEDDRIVEA